MDATGLRGTLAARDFAPGDVVAAVPFNLTVAVGGHAALASVRAGMLVLLLRPAVWRGSVPCRAGTPHCISVIRLLRTGVPGSKFGTASGEVLDAQKSHINMTHQYR